MFKRILVPVDLADTDLAKSAIETAVSLARASGGTIRLLNVLPATPTMLAEYVPADFDAQQRQTSDEALGIIGIPAGWARSLTDPVEFRREQDRLAHVWTFLGLTRDVANDGDWFRASLATRSVFVQRFGDEIRGFENRCAHRGYPLRNADK